MVLRESEERFRNIADSSPVMIWISAPDGPCTYFNKTWLEFRGRTHEQELGDGWAQGVHPEDLAHCLKVYHQALRTQAPFKMEYRLQRHDGEFRWILDHGIPRRDAEGRCTGFIGPASTSATGARSSR